MDEKKEEKVKGKATEAVETEPEAQGTDDSKDRDTSEGKTETKEPSMIDGAVLAAEELKKQNDRKEALLQKEEELQAKKVLGGSSEAGMQPPGKKKLTPEEIADAVAKGDLNPLQEDGYI